MARIKPDVYFDDGVRGWINKTARDQYRRVAGWYGIDSLAQDGYICYLKCRNKYTLGPPDNGYQDLNTDTPSSAQRRHFMDLVKRSFANHINTLATRYPMSMERPVSELTSDGDEATVLEGLMPAQQEEASVMVALAQAPGEIRDAINTLINDGIEGGQYLRSRLREKDGRVTVGKRALRETTTVRLARILGDPDLSGKTLAYLTS